jgi:twinfilin-like protein
MADFSKVVPTFERHTAAFVLYRLDSTDASAGGHEWVLLSYVPDGSPVKQRMLYASTRFCRALAAALLPFAPSTH